MLPVLIFDLDDTLILQDQMTRRTFEFVTAFLGFDPEKLWTEFQKHSQATFESLISYSYCKSIGISSQEGLWGEFGGPSPELNRLRTEIPRYRIDSWSKTLAAFGLKSAELARSISQDFAELRGRRYYPFADALSVLEALKPQYSLAILTNGAPELQWSKVHKSGLESYFDSVTVSGDYSIGKPKKEIFEIVFSKHPGAKQFLMIGNSLSSDIQGAQNAGIPSVWFEQGDEPKNVPVKPTYTIRSLTELLKLVPTIF